MTAGFFIIQGYQNIAIAIGWFAGINTPKINFLCNFTGSPISTEKDTADKINLYIDNDSITLQNKKSATLKYRFTIIGVRDSWY